MRNPKGKKRKQIKINLISDLSRGRILQTEPQVLRRTNTKGLKIPSAHIARQGIILRTYVWIKPWTKCLDNLNKKIFPFSKVIGSLILETRLKIMRDAMHWTLVSLSHMIFLLILEPPTTWFPPRNHSHLWRVSSVLEYTWEMTLKSQFLGKVQFNLSMQF